MKIYDCFTFFNELEVLEIRLNILNDYVDYFVIVEATKTHAGKPKELYYLKNKNKFKKFENKIIHVIVDDMPEIKESRWELENFQRNAIIRGLKNCEPDDIILISDVDEIPNPEKIIEVKEKLKTSKSNKVFSEILKFTKKIFKITRKNNALSLPFKIILSYPIILFRNKVYMYYLNGYVSDRWIGTAALRYEDLIKIFEGQPQLVRDIRSRFFVFFNVLKDAGWHFSYLGGAERVLTKLKSFSHSEYDTPEFANIDKINKIMAQNKTIDGKEIKFVKIDNTFPEYIVKNKEKYKHLINETI
jgi:beta-1,4-mannosyl-glycoprotein beta-1,4-N-acetylglucosaminyltransferase